jgi:hypothetical protein
MTHFWARKYDISNLFISLKKYRDAIYSVSIKFRVKKSQAAELS